MKQLQQKHLYGSEAGVHHHVHTPSHTHTHPIAQLTFTFTWPQDVGGYIATH